LSGKVPCEDHNNREGTFPDKTFPARQVKQKDA